MLGRHRRTIVVWFAAVVALLMLVALVAPALAAPT